MSPESMMNIKVFYCYAREDETLRYELEKHLGNLKRQGQITDWHDRKISAGKDWASEIDTHLNTANIILLLVSPSFIASDYCYGIEMKKALARYETGEARVIPIILRPVAWKEAPFSKLQALPTDGKPVTAWSNLDVAFLDVAQGIQKVVEELTLKYEEQRVQAQRALSNNRLQEALKLLEDINLAQAPSPIRWRLAALRGQCYFGLRQFVSAQRDFLSAVAEKPEIVLSDQSLEVMLLYLHLAAASRELGRLNDAFVQYQVAFGMMNAGTSPRYVTEAHWGLAFTAFGLAKQEAEASDSAHVEGQLVQTALSHAESARTLCHASGDELSTAALSCEIGLIQQSTGRLNEARVLLQGILEKWQPTLAEPVEDTPEGRLRRQERANIVSAAACYLAGVELEAGNYQKALTNVRQAEDAGNQSYILRRAEAAMMLGKILEEMSKDNPEYDGEEAELAFRRAVQELKPTNRLAARILAHDLLGRHLLKKGRISDGERELNRARTLSHFEP